jgi:REP element-mobilizing transposase RayT
MERKTNHWVYNINYHIMFCQKYRCKAITGKIEGAVKQTICETCTTYGATSGWLKSNWDASGYAY